MQVKPKTSILLDITSILLELALDNIESARTPVGHQTLFFYK
jgi:hypothetical protein